MILSVRLTSAAFSRAALAALTVVLVSSLLGCAGETGIVVEVTSPDLAVPGDVDTLRFEAEGALGLMASGVYPISTRWPHSLAIRPRAGDGSGGVTVHIFGLKGGVEVASTTVMAAFREGETVTVEAVLTRCVGPGCVVGDGGMDLGVDGGEVLDGGSDDLGESDLGTDDLGVDDLGAVDLGGSDLGPMDLGSSDLGPVDLGPTDLGRDLGPVDLGPTDLGPMDLGSDLGPVDLGADLGPMDLGPTDLGIDDLGTDLGPTDMGAVAPLLGSLVLSEVATGSAAVGGTDEFVEIYNRTSVPIDIGGVTLSYRSASGTSLPLYALRATVPAGVVLPPYSYYLFSSVGYVAAAVVTADQPGAWTSGFSVTGGHVQLARGTEVIDTLGWRTAVAPEGTALTAPSTDGAWSYERKAYATSDIASMTTGADALHGNGSDTNDNGVDFIVRPTRDPQHLASTPETP